MEDPDIPRNDVAVSDEEEVSDSNNFEVRLDDGDDYTARFTGKEAPGLSLIEIFTPSMSADITGVGLPNVTEETKLGWKSPGSEIRAWDEKTKRLFAKVHEHLNQHTEDGGRRRRTRRRRNRKTRRSRK